MLNGQTPKMADAEFNPPPPLSTEEKIALASKLGEKLRDGTGLPTEREIIEIVTAIVGGPIDGDGENKEPPAKTNQAKLFVENLLKPEGKKAVRSVLGLEAREKFKRDPITVVRQLKPKALDQYTLAELEAFVKDDSEYDDDNLEERINRLRAGDKLTRSDAARDLQRIQRMTYHEPPKFWSLWKEDGGVITEVGNELTTFLMSRGLLDRSRKGIVREKVGAACKILFGIKDAGETREMDQHAYHIAIRERYRNDIKALARSLLVQAGELPNLEALGRYHGEIKD
jgi:hypothetical protein